MCNLLGSIQYICGVFFVLLFYCFLREISHFPLIYQQWHFEDFYLMADLVITVVLKIIARGKGELPENNKHTIQGLKTWARWREGVVLSKGSLRNLEAWSLSLPGC